MTTTAIATHCACGTALNPTSAKRGATRCRTCNVKWVVANRKPRSVAVRIGTCAFPGCDNQFEDRTGKTGPGQREYCCRSHETRHYRIKYGGLTKRDKEELEAEGLWDPNYVDPAKRPRSANPRPRPVPNPMPVGGVRRWGRRDPLPCPDCNSERTIFKGRHYVKTIKATVRVLLCKDCGKHHNRLADTLELQRHIPPKEHYAQSDMKKMIYAQQMAAIWHRTNRRRA